MDYLPKPSLALVATFFSMWLVYLAGLAIYRLYLSPIAHFPGPKLAALSRWYEIYYEVVLKGQFTFHIQELHKKYGPIIRVNPDELHIEDSDYFDQLYSRTARLDKYDYTSGRFGNDSSVFTTAGHNLHALRRGVLNPMFSKRSILNFQPVIREKLEILCKRIAEFKAKGKEFSFSHAWSALTGDIITVYSFGECYNHLEGPDFKESFHDAYMTASEFGHIAVHFPWLHPILNRLPDELVGKMEPGLRMLLVLQRDLGTNVKRIMSGENESHTVTEHPTIFHELIESDLPPQEKSVQRLVHESQTIIGAGLETTAWAMSVACFHIINNPAISKKLRTELENAIPDPSAELDWQKLEKLPYLTGCIQEAIRLSYGVTARNPRVNLTAAMKYKEWVIPPGTPVAMTSVDVHHDESIFPNSTQYLPERWLDNPRTANGSPLSRYFVAFGKDARSCLGINLAYAELYLSLATVFRRFTFQLYETDVSDVELAHDFFLPAPKLDSKGVRVKVVAAE